MKRSLKVVLCGALLAAMGGAALAGFAKPEDAIRYRRAVMTIMGQHFGRLEALVKGETPYDKKEAEHNAKVIQTMSELPWEAVMVPGSDKGDTTLKASAMQEKDKFMAIAQQFQKATQKLADTAGNGNLKALKAQFIEVADNCSTCHKAYRKK